jgi:hypothetical protein
MAVEQRDEGGATVALDRMVEAGRTYYYRLVVKTSDDQTITFGPLSGTAGVAIAEFALPRLAPNPSRGPTLVEFTLPREERVRLSVLDVQGREVTVLADGVYPSGRYQATWSGKTGRGEAAVGLYFVRYRTPAGDLVRRLVVTR